MKIVAQYPLHHVTCAPAKFEGFIWRCIYKKIHNLTFGLDLEVNVTQNVAQYPLRHAIYASAKLKVVRSNGFGEDTITRNVSDGHTYEINMPYFSNEKAGIKIIQQCHQARSIPPLYTVSSSFTYAVVSIYFQSVWTMITCRQCVEHLLGVQEVVLEHCAYL